MRVRKSIKNLNEILNFLFKLKNKFIVNNDDKIINNKVLVALEEFGSSLKGIG